MKAKVSFSVGKAVYEKGDIVPAEVAAKYPRLVEQATEKEKKEFEEKPEKKSEGELFLSTEKVKRKKREV